MAELGTIDFQNLEAGAVRPSSGEDLLRGIGQTLDAIGELHVQDVLGEAKDEQEEILRASREQALKSEAPALPSDANLGEAGEITRRFEVLNAQRSLGNSSQRELAELHLNQLYNKYYDKHPTLINRLRQQHGLAVQTSTELTELGIIDQINQQNAKLAQEEFQQLVDYGYASVEDGGLNIPVHIRPGTERYAKMWAERTETKDKSNQIEANLAFLAASTDTSLEAAYPVFTAAMQQKGNLVNAKLLQYADELRSYYNEVSKGTGADQNKIFQFKQTVLPKLEVAFAQLKQDILMTPHLLRDRMGITNTQGSVIFGQMEAMAADKVKMLDDLLTAYKGDDVTQMALMQTAIAANEMNFRNQNPTYGAVTRFFNLGEDQGWLDVLEQIAKWDITNLNLNTTNQLAGGLLQVMHDTLGDTTPEMMANIFRAGGQGQITDQSTPEQIDSTLKLQWNGNGTSSLFGRNKTGDPDTDDLRSAAAYINLLGQAARDESVINSPGSVAKFLTPAINGFLAMNAIGNPSEDLVTNTIGVLADYNIVKATMAGGNDVNKARRQKLGQEADTFYTNTAPAALEQSIKNQLSRTTVAGQPVLALVDVIYPEERDGRTEFTFNVNRDKVRQAAKVHIADPEALRFTESQVDGWVREVQTKFAPLLSKINTHIRAMAHIDALKQDRLDDKTVDYTYMAEDLGWVDFLMVPDNAQR